MHGNETDADPDPEAAAAAGGRPTNEGEATPEAGETERLEAALGDLEQKTQAVRQAADAAKRAIAGLRESAGG